MISFLFQVSPLENPNVLISVQAQVQRPFGWFQELETTISWMLKDVELK